MLNPDQEIRSFSDLPLSKPVLAAIASAGYETPTEVQAVTIPLVLAGIDLIVQSQTGTGKTAAFAAPIAEMLDSNPGTIQALVLAPTRELAIQVAGEFKRVGCDARNIGVLPVYGGASIGDQIEGLKKAEVITATPGRMLDLLRRKATELSNLRVLVLDEADEMLSMGFERELKAIIEFLPEDRQSLMLSATVTEGIKVIAADLLSYPEFLTFSTESLGAEDIDHYYYMISGIGRFKDLYRLIELEQPENAIVFCNTRDSSSQVANYLKQQGYSAEVLNGELPQAEREKVMGRMRAERIRFLVATDIAARGIDLSFLPCVINYVLPESAEGYVHRTGRTGRAGRGGVAYSLIAPKEIGMFYQLRRAYKFDLKARELPADEALTELRERRALDTILEGLDAEGELDYGSYLSFVDAFPKLPDYRSRLAKLMAFFVSHRNELAVSSGTPPEQPEPPTPSPAPAKERPAKPAPVRERPAKPAPAKERPAKPAPVRERPAKPAPVKERQREDTPQKPKERPAPEKVVVPSQPRMRTIRLNVGKDMIDSSDTLMALVEELAGLERTDLGVTTMYPKRATIEVREDYVADVVEAINGERIGEFELKARY